ncbi:MAG: saccharopine dehydrogenase NADP-binding domain-containing protein [Chitinophagaceae bacterium]
MHSNKFLLYGANGYTGELIARFAGQYGLQPILAGRNKSAIEALARQLDLPFLVFDLHDTYSLKDALNEVNLVVHAAGPYDFTAQPMIEACIETNTHYIDLNGDADVFELLMGYDKQAKESNIMVMPGAGFDVVPTDCLSLFLKNRLPDATDLTIAFVILGSALSRGTSLTTLLKLGMPGATRQNGVLVPEPVGKRGMWVEFEGYKKQFMMSIPWGDISTAYFSTGIPNIVTYTGIQKSVWNFLKFQSAFNWLLRTSFVRAIVRKIITSKSSGPNDTVRDKAVSLIQAKVSNKKGETLTAAMQCPEAYSVTAYTILLIAQKILNGQFKSGYQTPASAYGEDLIMEIPGVSRKMI